MNIKETAPVYQRAQFGIDLIRYPVKAAPINPIPHSAPTKVTANICHENPSATSNSAGE